MEVRLLSDGKFSYFPSVVYMDIFKVKQIIKLSSAGNDTYDDVVTECLDEVIDFEKTGVIKSSSELCAVDRAYLMLRQRIEADSSDLKFSVMCKKCGNRNSVIVYLKDIKENFLRKLKPYSGRYNVVIPSIKRIRDINSLFNSIKDDEVGEKYYKEVDGVKVLNDEATKYLFLLTYITDFDYLDLEGRINEINNLDVSEFYKVLDFVRSNEFGLHTNIKFSCRFCGSNNYYEYLFTDVRDFF